MKFDPSIGLSESLEFGNLISELRKKGEEIISLGLGEPDFDTPDEIKNAAIQAIKNGQTRYSSASGLLELRELICEKLRRENNIDASPGEIIVVPGAKNALFLSLAATLEPGDEIINFTPCYISNIPLIHLAEPLARIINVDMNKEDFSIDIETLRSRLSLRTRAILINFPNNPTGTILSWSVLKELIEICIDRNLILISDEIYEMIYFGTDPFFSPASDRQLQNQVITINGFSKPFSMTGWRIGYIHTKNPILYQRMLKMHQHINTNTPAFTQFGAIEGLKKGKYIIDRFKENLKVRSLIIKNAFAETKNLSIVPPTGGIFSFLNISRLEMTSHEFSMQLLKKKRVAILAGKAFGDSFDDHCRLSLVNETALIAEGVKRIIDFSENS